MKSRYLAVFFVTSWSALACGGEDGASADGNVGGASGSGAASGGGASGFAGASGSVGLGGTSGDGGFAGNAGSAGDAGTAGTGLGGAGAGGAGAGGSGATGSGGTPSGGIRAYRAIGTKGWARQAFDKPLKGWATTEWNKTMAGAYKDYACAFQKHVPAITAKLRWSEAYIDQNIKPTPAQARDPNWSNYIWNKTGSPGGGAVWDGVTDALNSSFIDNGKGPAKLQVVVTLTATTDDFGPPAWLRKTNLAWLEGVNADGNAKQLWYVRYDKADGVNHAADFMTAFLKKYGNNEGVYAISSGEYYLGATKYRPADLDRAAYARGARDLWKKMVAAAPKDSNGNRVNLLQINPIFDGGVVLQDLKDIGVSLGESDTQLQLPLEDHAKNLVNARKMGMHVSMDGDARYACINFRKQGWDGTPNPFGHNKGYSGIATPQELFWYHGNKGPVPLDSIFMTIANYCSTGIQTTDNFRDAIKRFGRCGTDAGTWGPSPAD